MRNGGTGSVSERGSGKAKEDFIFTGLHSTMTQPGF
jgi:hypothetical protein